MIRHTRNNARSAALPPHAVWPLDASPGLLDHRDMRRQPRRQFIDMGTSRAIRLGGPGIGQDVYNWTMEASWPRFVVLTMVLFVSINVVFGLVYAAVPGAIANMPPGSFANGFFFSIETLATVGYGNLSPSTTLGHAIASAEIMIGLFYTATITGLIFARFARPRKSLIFSKVAVICDYEGQRALMVRLAPMHARPLATVTAQISLLQRTVYDDGREIARLVDLPLLRPSMAMVNLSWTLIHLLDDDSPVLATLASDQPFWLIVTVGGLDTLLARQSFGGHGYQREDVIVGHHYADVISNKDGVIHLDMGRMDHTEPGTA